MRRWATSTMAMPCTQLLLMEHPGTENDVRVATGEPRRPSFANGTPGGLPASSPARRGGVSPRSRRGPSISGRSGLDRYIWLTKFVSRI